MDLDLDAHGDLIPTELSWSQLAERMSRPPVRRPMLVSRRLYAVLTGRTYPEPFRYLASWTEARRLSELPRPPGTWQSLFAELDAQRRTT